MARGQLRAAIRHLRKLSDCSSSGSWLVGDELAAQSRATFQYTLGNTPLYKQTSRLWADGADRRWRPSIQNTNDYKGSTNHAVDFWDGYKGSTNHSRRQTANHLPSVESGKAYPVCVNSGLFWFLFSLFLSFFFFLLLFMSSLQTSVLPTLGISWRLIWKVFPTRRKVTGKTHSCPKPRRLNGKMSRSSGLCLFLLLPLLLFSVLQLVLSLKRTKCCLPKEQSHW